MKRLLLIAFTGSLLSGGVWAASDRVNLQNDERINTELTMAAVGDAIRKNCDKVVPRRFLIFSKAMALRDYVLGLGYTMDDIEEFLQNDQERARIMALRDSYLAERGVDTSNSEAYCQLAKSEIDEGTMLGRLMRMSD